MSSNGVAPLQHALLTHMLNQRIVRREGLRRSFCFITFVSKRLFPGEPLSVLPFKPNNRVVQHNLQPILVSSPHVAPLRGPAAGTRCGSMTCPLTRWKPRMCQSNTPRLRQWVASLVFVLSASPNPYPQGFAGYAASMKGNILQETLATCFP